MGTRTETTTQAAAVERGTDGRKVETVILDLVKDINNKLDSLREEIKSGDEQRVSKDAFREYQLAVAERLARLEASPMRALAWISLVCGLIGGPLLTVILFILRG